MFTLQNEFLKPWSPNYATTTESISSTQRSAVPDDLVPMVENMESFAGKIFTAEPLDVAFVPAPIAEKQEDFYAVLDSDGDIVTCRDDDNDSFTVERLSEVTKGIEKKLTTRNYMGDFPNFYPYTLYRLVPIAVFEQADLPPPPPEPAPFVKKIDTKNLTELEAKVFVAQAAIA